MNLALFRGATMRTAAQRLKWSDIFWPITLLGWLCSVLALVNITQHAVEVGLAPALQRVLDTYKEMIHPVSEALLWWLHYLVGPVPEPLKDACALSYLGAFAAARWELLRPDSDFDAQYVMEIFEKPEGAIRGGWRHTISVYAEAFFWGTIFFGLLTWGIAIAALPILPIGLFMVAIGAWTWDDFRDQIRPEFVFTVYTAPLMAFAFFVLNTQIR